MIKTFLTPKTIEEAVLLKKENPDSIYISGGAWINSSRSKLSPETVISVTGLELNKIEQTEQDIAFGTNVTLQEIIDSDLTPKAIKDILVLMRNRNLCNQGTLVGTVATKEPCFSVLSVLVAMKAVLETPKGDIEIEDYLKSNEDVLILKIRINKDIVCIGKKHSIAARSVPLVSVACAKLNKEIRLVVAQDAGNIVLLNDLELKATLTKDEIVEKIKNSVDSFDDYRGSEEFRKHIAAELLADCFIAVEKGV